MKSDTAATASSSKKKKRRLRRWRILLAFVCLALAAFIGFGWWVERELETLEAEIHAKGEPFTLAELDAYYPEVPDEKNGALVYLRAATILESFNGDEDYHDVEGSRLVSRLSSDTYSHETLAQIRAHLATRESVFEVLAEALKYSASRYPIDLGALDLSSWRTIFWGLHDLKQILWLQGFLAIQDRDWNAFSRSQRQLLHFANTLVNIPCGINEHGRIFLREATDLLQHAIATGEAPLSVYNTLSPMYARVDYGKMLRASLIGDRVGHTALIDWYHQENATRPSDSLIPWRASSYERYPWIPGLKSLTALEKRRGIWFYAAVLDDHDEPWRVRYRNAIERQPFGELWDYTWRRWTYLPDGTSTSRPLTIRDSLTLLFHPEMHGAATPMRRWFGFEISDPTTLVTYEEINLRCVRLAMCIDAYRQTTGTLPRTLDELDDDVVAAIGGDPFGDGPLGYRIVDGGFIVYSVGDDLVDNGGQKIQGDSGDRVVEFVRDTRVVPEKDPPPPVSTPGRGRRGRAGLASPKPVQNSTDGSVPSLRN